jgi:hypothetical protein
MSTNNIILDVPIVLDTSGDVTIMANNIDISNANFVFNVIDSSVDASNLANTIFYADNSVNENYIYHIDETNLKTFSTQVHNTILDNLARFSLIGSTDTTYTPQNNTYTSSLSEHYIQYVASTLFGHPLAQAPINNEAAIQTQIESADVSNQIFNSFTTDLSYTDVTVDDISLSASVTGLVSAMFEQLLQYGGERFGTNDSSFNTFPIYKDDVIRFIVRIQGKINSSTSTSNTTNNFTNTEISLQKVYNYLIDSQFDENNPDQNSAFSHRPLYIDSVGDVRFKPKNWVVSLKLISTANPIYGLDTNYYSSLGTPVKFQVVGNKAYLDTPITSLYPTGHIHFALTRNITNATTTTASYESVVDIPIDITDNTDPIETYEASFNFISQNGGTDISYIELTLNENLQSLFKTYKKDHNANDFDNSMVLVTGNRFSLQNGRYDIDPSYNGNSHFIVDKEYIYFFANKNSTETSDITETFVYDISTSTTTDASYILTSTTTPTPPTRTLTVHNSNNQMDISNGTTSLHTYAPFIYIEDGVYSISNEYFSTTNMDMSVNGTEVQLYGDACMNSITDPNPFIMTYDLSNSNSTIATYSFIDTTPDPDVSYTVTISSSSNEIRFNNSFNDISNIIISGVDISYSSLF